MSEYYINAQGNLCKCDGNDRYFVMSISFFEGFAEPTFNLKPLK